MNGQKCNKTAQARLIIEMKSKAESYITVNMVLSILELNMNHTPSSPKESFTLRISVSKTTLNIQLYKLYTDEPNTLCPFTGEANIIDHILTRLHIFWVDLMLKGFFSQKLK